MAIMDDNIEARYGYYDCIYDLMRGISEEEVRECMKHFEEREAYEYLAGVEIAISDFKIRLKETEAEEEAKEIQRLLNDEQDIQ